MDLRSISKEPLKWKTKSAAILLHSPWLLLNIQFPGLSCTSSLYIIRNSYLLKKFPKKRKVFVKGWVESYRPVSRGLSEQKSQSKKYVHYPPAAYAQPKPLVVRRKVLSQDDCEGDYESLNSMAASEFFVQL